MIGILGGSGFYKLFDRCREEKVNTPYGAPSDKISLGEIAGRKIVFLPRHNKTHDLPPHQINYRANIYALHSLGVDQIFSITAVGSLQKKIKRGDFVVLDQFVDRTKNRIDTFYDGPVVTHISTAYPYCPVISRLAYETGKKIKLRIHLKGTIVIINGPRFSTAAESLWYTKMGWDVINMTQYPEVSLARELGICYSAIGLVTDYDVGIVAREKLPPVTFSEIGRVFKENNERALDLVYKMIKNWPAAKKCGCEKVLEEARI